MHILLETQSYLIIKMALEKMKLAFAINSIFHFYHRITSPTFLTRVAGIFNLNNVSHIRENRVKREKSERERVSVCACVRERE